MNDISKHKEIKFVGKDLLHTWLQFSRSVSNYVTKPQLTLFVPKFIMHACYKLKLDKTVFFMSIEITEKYTEVTPITNYTSDPVLTLLVIILISSKLMGYRPNINVETLLDFLHEENFGEYEAKTLASLEIRILKKIQFNLPLQTTYDEMNILLDLLIEPMGLFINFQPQCTEIMKLYYLYSTTISEVLDEMYANKRAHLKKLFKNKLYVPAGVIITAAAMSSGLNVISLRGIIKSISTLSQISTEDLQIIYTTILETINKVISNCEK